MASNRILVRVEALGMRFGAVQALHGVDLEIVDDDKVAGIIGPNGAGKSTLLSIIAGELKASAGSVKVLEQDIRSASADRVARLGVARTFQVPRPLLGMTVEDNVIASGLCKGTLREARGKAGAILEMLSLDERKNDFPGELNLAARKRLELSKALMTDPKVLLSDELFEGLNEHDVDWLVALLKDRVAPTVKIVMVEHVMSALRSLANVLYVLDRGELIAQGGTEEVLADENVIEAYLGRT